MHHPHGRRGSAPGLVGRRRDRYTKGMTQQANPTNRIQLEAIQPEPCPRVDDPAEVAGRYGAYLGDESRLGGEDVRALYRPASEAQVAAALMELAGAGSTCVLSAARTGIAGAAAPVRTHAVVTLEKLNGVLGLGRDEQGYRLRCRPGVTLAEIAAFLDARAVDRCLDPTPAEAAAARTWRSEGPDLWLPVDPTEQSAQLGGAVATNASGARTYRHGAIRDWVRALTVILPEGQRLRLRREQVRAVAGRFVLVQPNGAERALDLPLCSMPETKCTAGYYLWPEMDAIDLFIGAEGTLGAVVEVEIALTERPPAVLGVVAILPDEARALDFVEAARRGALPFDALEYFDAATIQLLRGKHEAEGGISAVPPLPAWDGPAVYVELWASPETTAAALDGLATLLGRVGGAPERAWAATTPRELERMKGFRHAVPETVNAIIGQRKRVHPLLHKVGTDMAVPDKALRAIFRLYRDGLAASGLESVVFGHIGDNHVHVNILPRDEEELTRAKGLYLQWAREAVALGGSVSAEHGIGRLKRAMLAIQYPEEVIAGMRAIRRVFDPKGVLAPGVLFDAAPSD